MKSPHRPLRELRVKVAPGRSLGAAEFGDPTGFPVLWFHGTPGGRLQVPPDAPASARAGGLRLIAVERPGTGWSSEHRYRVLREFATDVSALVDELGLDRFAVVGLSGGGPYTLACAHDLASRVAAAVVIGGMGPTSGPEAVPSYTRLLALGRPVLDLVAGPLGRALPAVVRPIVPFAHEAIVAFSKVAPKADAPILLDPAFEAVLVGDILHVYEDGLGAAVHDARLFAKDWGFRLRDVKAPVHFFQGDADGIVPESHGHHQARLVPRSRLTIVPGGGHLAGYVSGARIFGALAPFLAT